MADITFVKNFPFSKSPAICIKQGVYEYPICYIRKAKGCTDEEFDEFINALVLVVKKGFLDKIEKQCQEE